MAGALLQTVQRVGRSLLKVLSINVNIAERFAPVSSGAGFGPRIIPVHVDVADAVVRRFRHSLPGDDDLTGVVTVEHPYVGSGRGATLEVWPESHSAGFALSLADVLQPYSA